MNGSAFIGIIFSLNHFHMEDQQYVVFVPGKHLKGRHKFLFLIGLEMLKFFVVYLLKEVACKFFGAKFLALDSAEDRFSL